MVWSDLLGVGVAGVGVASVGVAGVGVGVGGGWRMEVVGQWEGVEISGGKRRTLQRCHPWTLRCLHPRRQKH